MQTPTTQKKWIAQLGDSDNALAVLKNLIQLTEARITDTSLAFHFENHPDYPSLNAINETLQKWDFETMSVKVKKTELHKVILPAIAYLEKDDRFVIIGEITGDHIFYLDPAKGWLTEKINTFCENWQGILLMASPGENSLEPDFEQLMLSQKNRNKIRIDLDCVYVLSLDTSEDAKEAFKTRLGALQLGEQTKLEFFDAVVGKNVDETFLKRYDAGLYPHWKLKNSPNKWWNTEMKDGEVGCALSHYLIWKDAYEKNYKNILILEEDFLILSDNFSSVSQQFPWELYYLGRKAILPDIHNLNAHTVVPDYSYCTYSYLLTRTGIGKLLASNFHKNIIPVDEYLSAMFCDHPRRDLLTLYPMPNGRLQCLAVKQNLIVQQSNRVSTTEASTSYQVDRTTLDLFFHKELYATKKEGYEAWVKRFVNPLIISKDYDLILDEVAPNVYKFPLFTSEFCRILVEEAEYRNKWTGDRHINYPTYDVTLKKLGLHEVYLQAMNEFIMPMAMHIWQLKGNAWTNMNADNFIAKYTTDVQSHLSAHHDGSDVTINVCLNNEFTGAGTVFPKYKAVVKLNEPGYAIMHPGGITHLHGARPITGGKRYILVSFLSKPSQYDQRN